MKKCILLILLFHGIYTHGQNILNDVPKELKEDANIITVFDHSTLEIISRSTSKYKRHYKKILLNKYTAEERYISLGGYSAFQKITNARLKIYDQYGRQISYKKLKDFMDISQKYDLAGDSRDKVFEVEVKQYPVAIELEYETEFNEFMFFPQWYPQDNENMSIKEASLTITSPESLFRYDTNLDQEPAVSKNDDSRLTYSWELQNVRPRKHEYFNSNTWDDFPHVKIAPTQFIMGGIPGDMSDWNKFGSFINELIKNQNNLSEADLHEIRQLTDTIQSTREKVKAVYHYLQNNTHYVAISYGIGGWQPFASGFTHEKKYGECKGLSFYTKSLLEGIGISSNYTIIEAGYNGSELNNEFPISEFNHVILTVPMENDTVWLECTSQTNPFGYMGTFTSDRDALLITEEGGKVIRTKVYTEEDNIQKTTATVILKENGDATVSLKRDYKGIEIENYNFENVWLLTETEKKEWFLDKHRWGNKMLQSLEIEKPTDEAIPTGSMKADFSVQSLAKKTEPRLFYTPFLFTNALGFPTETGERKNDFNFRYGYQQIDSITVEFPENLTMENHFKPIELSTVYGKYSKEMIVENGKYIFVRRFQLNKGNYPKSEFSEFRSFIKEVQKGDRQRIVMIKN